MLQVYRSHPAIVSALSYAAYDNNLFTTITARDRQKITSSTVPLPKEKYPIVLIDCKGKSVKLPTYSRRNKIQCLFTKNLVQQLARLCPQLRICVTTYYKGDFIHLKQELYNELQGGQNTLDFRRLQTLDVSTVSAYIGGETDVQILVTGADGPTTCPTQNQTDEFDQKPENFVFNDQIATVALSRGAHALFIVGDMQYLASQRGSVLSKFLTYVEINTPALQPEEYLHLITRTDPVNIPTYNQDEYLISTEHLVSNTEFNKMSRWKERWIAFSLPNKPPVRNKHSRCVISE